MFGFLRRLFGRIFRKKNLQEQQTVEFPSPQPQEELQPPLPQPLPVNQERVAPHSSAEPDRPEKTCPKCGSPNDKFVHVCWMCKAEI